MVGVKERIHGQDTESARRIHLMFENESIAMIPALIPESAGTNQITIVFLVFFRSNFYRIH